MDATIIAVIASSATAMIATISTVVIKVLDDRNQLKLKKLELSTIEKRDAIKNYLITLDKLQLKPFSFSLDRDKFNVWEKDYKEKAIIVMLFLSEKARIYILAINEVVEKSSNLIGNGVSSYVSDSVIDSMDKTLKKNIADLTTAISKELV